MTVAHKALPKLAFARLSAPPDLGSVQFYDSYAPSLPAATYTINLTHTLSAVAAGAEPNPASPPVPAAFTASQTFAVRGPQFAIDPTAVQAFYPANGGACEGYFTTTGGDMFQLTLPYVMLGDPSLPWERDLTPDSETPTPWMALLLFQEDEIVIGSGSSSPLTQITVQDFIAGSSTILPPKLPETPTDPGILASSCQVVTLKGGRFYSVLPGLADLPLLAHCRASNVAGEDSAMVAVLLANRLALAPSATTQYFAHLVSLEGFVDHLAPAASALPNKLNSQDPLDVRLISLASWRFTATRDAGVDFEALVAGLIASETTTATLSVPLPVSSAGEDALATVTGRLKQGYAPLNFVTGAYANSFAWYRGPLTAEPAQPLPASAGQPISVTAESADALMIYLADQGLFDLSYAAAWQIGRALALADASFAEAITAYRSAAAATLSTIVQRMSIPHFADTTDIIALIAPTATRRRFAELAAEGMGLRWNNELIAARAGGKPAVSTRPARPPHPRVLLRRPEVLSALADRLSDQTSLIADWLLDLTLLKPVPFSHLVPDPAMLPTEAIRFFYVDAGWTQALVAGASSLAIHGTKDLELHKALHGALHAAMARRRPHRLRRLSATADPHPAEGSGLLIRSQIVAAYPQLVIQGFADGVPLTIARDDRPSTSVRLCLFDGVPDLVTLSEPYQGLRFGLNDQGVPIRDLSGKASGGTGSLNGQLLPKQGNAGGFVNAYCRQDASSGSTNGVLQPQKLADDLTVASGSGKSIAGGGLALQLIQLPEQQVFPTQANG